MSLVVATSMVNIFWKEVASARERNDVERIRHLYRSLTHGLYFVTMWIGCLIIPYARDLLVRTVGPGYEAASLPLVVLCLSSAQQSLGHIALTYLYVSGKTPSPPRSASSPLTASIPLTYLMLASPSTPPGFGLGAGGLAVKTLALQIIGVNIFGFLIARTSGWAYENRYQSVGAGALLGLGWACSLTGLGVFGSGGAVAGSLPAIAPWGHPLRRAVAGDATAVSGTGGSFASGDVGGHREPRGLAPAAKPPVHHECEA